LQHREQFASRLASSVESYTADLLQPSYHPADLEIDVLSILFQYDSLLHPSPLLLYLPSLSLSRTSITVHAKNKTPHRVDFPGTAKELHLLLLPGGQYDSLVRARRESPPHRLNIQPSPRQGGDQAAPRSAVGSGRQSSSSSSEGSPRRDRESGSNARGEERPHSQGRGTSPIGTRRSSSETGVGSRSRPSPQQSVPAPFRSQTASTATTPRVCRSFVVFATPPGQKSDHLCCPLSHHPKVKMPGPCRSSGQPPCLKWEAAASLGHRRRQTPHPPLTPREPEGARADPRHTVQTHLWARCRIPFEEEGKEGQEATQINKPRRLRSRLPRALNQDFTTTILANTHPVPNPSSIRSKAILSGRLGWPQNPSRGNNTQGRPPGWRG